MWQKHILVHFRKHFQLIDTSNRGRYATGRSRSDDKDKRRLTQMCVRQMTRHGWHWTPDTRIKWYNGHVDCDLWGNIEPSVEHKHSSDIHQVWRPGFAGRHEMANLEINTHTHETYGVWYLDGSCASRRYTYYYCVCVEVVHVLYVSQWVCEFVCVGEDKRDINIIWSFIDFAKAT